MKKHTETLFLLIALIFISFSAIAQNELKMDIDFDGVTDTIFIDTEKSTIVCLLSSKNFKRVESNPIEILNPQSRITDARNGFYFENEWMTAGYSNQFRYDKKLKRIRLIGMSRYEFGNAANDGSGESSVNLLTGDYLGNWNYYDNWKEELIKIPEIKTKMHFNKIYLENFEEEVYFDFATKCSKLYYRYREIVRNKRK
ncbi:hypothetical protein [Aquimarina addita]